MQMMIRDKLGEYSSTALHENFESNNVLSNNDPNESTGATYGNCANKYHDILYQNLAPAYLDLQLGRFGDAKSELQKALLIHNQCLNLLKNMKYPAFLGFIRRTLGPMLYMLKAKSSKFLKA